MFLRPHRSPAPRPGQGTLVSVRPHLRSTRHQTEPSFFCHVPRGRSRLLCPPPVMSDIILWQHFDYKKFNRFVIQNIKKYIYN